MAYVNRTANGNGDLMNAEFNPDTNGSAPEEHTTLLPKPIDNEST